MASFKVFGAPLKIRYSGFFDWGGLYRLVWDWLQKRQFRVHEKRYKDKPDTPLGSEIEVDVTGEREVTEYYKYKVAVSYHLWESKEVPVIIKGKQGRRMRGRIHISIEGEVITDWQGRFKKNGLYKAMGEFLDKVILKYDRNIKYIDPLDKDLHRLEAEIKKFLKMETQASSVG
ncbi:MAG TPA: hypothetical protein ENL16_00955 [Candidatus Woesearchaeota archaeon]|nr:hypothetical protein [Candidatus Woesearchaeota archaeon]